MTSPKPTRHTVTFLPWVRFKDSVEIENVVFWRFPSDEFRLDKRLMDQLLRMFRGYRDPKGRRIEDLTIVSLRHRLFKDLSRKEAERVAELIRLVAFSVMAENVYFRQVGVQFNSSQFQHFHQRFQLGSKGIAVDTRRREGSALHGGYQHGELKFSMPLQNETTFEAMPNVMFLRSLVEFVGRETADASAVRQAINWFFLANSNSDSVSLHTEIIMMGSAFEALFQTQDTSGKKAALMDNLPIPFTDRLSKEARRAGMDGSVAKRQWKAWWIDEFYWLRNKIAHGSKIELTRMTWDVTEHLTIAAIILAITIKLILAQKGGYLLTSSEEVCADSVDNFIAGGNLSERKLIEAHNNAGLKRATERAWLHIQAVQAK